MVVRPPSDAVVAMRSLPRRFRALFAVLEDDESPDALAQRAGADGSSALRELANAIRALTTAAKGLAEVLAQEGTAVADPRTATAEDGAGGSLEERLSELDQTSDALADQVDRVDADAWTGRATLAATGESVSPLDLVWWSIDAAVAALGAAERTLAEVRGR